MKIPDKYAFWRWPAKIRSLTNELEQLKEEHARVLAGQSKLLEWVKVTHRLTSPAQGIRALLQNGKRLVPLLVLLLGLQAAWTQPAPPILRQPLTTNSHFGPTPTEGQVPIWNATVKKWSNNAPTAVVSTPHTWTNDNGTLKPIAFPTNILFRVNVPDDGIGTNFYFDSRVNRTNAKSKLFVIANGGSNAVTVGPDGGLFMGRGNTGPFPGGVLYGIFDTALGETNQQEIFTLSGNSAVGYSGASDLIIDTNYGALILFANKEGGVKFTRFSVQAGAGDNPQDFNSFTMQALVDGATYMQMDPNFSLLTPTNYLFSSSIRITNTDTLLSLQNSNFPVLEVDGVGDLRLIKKIPYLWPSSQGAAGTALTNDGTGALGWWPVSAGGASSGLTTNANQFLGVPLSIKDGAFLTNINIQSSLEVSNGWIYASGPVTNGTQLNLPHLTVSRSAVINAQGDVTNSSADSNWSLYPTNVWNDRQFGSQNLTNWSNIPTGAMANVVATDYLTNWANAISNLTQTKQFGSANLTNWSNIPTGTMANVVSTTFLTNWANAISNLAETKQFGSAVLTNLVSTVGKNVTNFVSLSTTNATSKPLTNSYTAGTLTMFGIEQGSGQAITMNASNIVVAIDWAQTASTTNVVGVSNWVNSVSNLVQTKQNGSAVLTNLVSTVANNVTNVVSLSTTNATSKPLTNAYASGVLTLFGIEQGSGLAVTMSSNIVVANDWAQTASTTNVVGVSNWVNSVSNLAQTKQFGSATLTNLSGTGAITNLFTASLSNATIKPLVVGVGNAAGATNTTGEIRGLEAGANITLTPNGSNYVIAATLAGGAVTFADLLWTNEPSGRIHPVTFTNRLEVHRSITIGTNSANYFLAPNTNDFFFAGRDITKAEDWDPQFVIGAFSNGVVSVVTFIISHLDAGISFTTTDENGNGSTVNIDANAPSGPSLVMLSTNAYKPFASDLLTNTTLNNIRYQFPTGQGAAGTVLTNNGSGALGWSAQLQPSSTTLTNLSGTGAITNLFTLSLSNATIKPLVVGLGNAAAATNTTGEIRGLEAGANITLTPNGSNYVIAATLAGGAVTFADLLWTNEPAGRIHPVTFTNRIEVQRSITIGTNSLAYASPIDTNDFLFAYRDLTKGEDWAPRFEIGAISNGVISTIQLIADHWTSDITFLVSDEGGNTASAQFFASTVGGGPGIFLQQTNGFVPFAVGGQQTTINNVTYTFPLANGAAGTVLTNSGAGVLGWSAQLQPSSATLTNLSGTGAITNLFSPTLSNATIKPLVVGVGNAAGATNTTGEIRGLEAGANVTLTPNGSNVVIAASVTGGSVTFADLVWTNDTVALKPIAFPTNILFRVDVPDDGVGTNFYFDTTTYRANGASKLFEIRNGGSNALTVGPYGGIFSGFGNPTPNNLYAFNAIRDTAIGEPNSAYLQVKAANNTTVYYGQMLFGVLTNSSELVVKTFEASSGRQGFFDVMSDAYTNVTLKLVNQVGATSRGAILTPGVGAIYPTNYLFNSFYELTNIHTLLSLQNSNTPVFEVNGIGDLKLLKRVAYSWPSAQGSAQTVLTNDGSGNLGWGAVAASGGGITTNASQFGASVQLTLRDGVTVTNANNIGILNITNAPGSDRALRIWQTNGQAYIDFAAPTNQWLPTNRFVFSVTNPVAGQVFKFLNVDFAAGVASITVTNGTDNIGLLTNANQFAANATLTIKESALFTNAFLYPSNVTGPAEISYASSGQATNLTEWRQTNGAVGLAISSNGLYNLAIPLLLSNAIVFRTNQIDFKAAQWQTFSNALKTNLVLQLTNCNDGAVHTLEAFGAGRLGNGITNAWQLLCTVAAGNTIYWPPGSTNGNYDVLVNSNQVVTFTFRQVFNTNIFASYLVREAGGAN